MSRSVCFMPSRQRSRLGPFSTSMVIVTSEMPSYSDLVPVGRGATLALRCAMCHAPGVEPRQPPNLAGNTRYRSTRTRGASSRV